MCRTLRTRWILRTRAVSTRLRIPGRRGDLPCTVRKDRVVSELSAGSESYSTDRNDRKLKH